MKKTAEIVEQVLSEAKARSSKGKQASTRTQQSSRVPNDETHNEQLVSPRRDARAIEWEFDTCEDEQLVKMLDDLRSQRDEMLKLSESMRRDLFSADTYVQGGEGRFNSRRGGRQQAGGVGRAEFLGGSR